MDWQTIDTAPKDDSRILLYWPTLLNQPYTAVGAWQSERYYLKPRPYWQSDYRWGKTILRAAQPTLWLPLPDIPRY